MNRILGLILTAVFLSALSIPCGATGTETTTSREYPGFSDVAEGSASYEAVKLCYERGLMNGKTEDRFAPQEELTFAQLLTLGARLYSLRTGGSGDIPDPPDLNQPYFQFLSDSGQEIASWTPAEITAAYHWDGEGAYFALSRLPEDPALPERCTLNVGFQGFGPAAAFQGVKVSNADTILPQEDGYMSQPEETTGYRFSGADGETLDAACGFADRFVRDEYHLKDAWWYPAYFYLCAQNGLRFYVGLGHQISMDYREPVEELLSQMADTQDGAYCGRWFFAWLIDLLAGEQEVLNPSPRIPDLDKTRNQEEILRLYQAGILSGMDKEGTFNGRGTPTRGQAAIILARVLDPSQRVKTA